MMITVNDVQAAYPVFTGLTWTSDDTNYFFDIAYARVMSDLPEADEKTQILAMCYYIASLHEGAKGASGIAVTSESLGDHSYTLRTGVTLDCWGDRYAALVNENSDADVQDGALGGIENPEVPKELWLDRW